MKRRMMALLLAVVMLLTVLPVASASGSKLVALTFDDGPGVYTERLLDGLEARGARATFFCLGSLAERYPDTIRRMVAQGHQVANHSYSHPNLNAMSQDGALWEITRTDTILNEITGGSEAHYIRPPYGNSTQSLRSSVSAPMIIWSVDTIDWKVRNAEKVKNNILNDTFDGAIVLMHDIHAFTVDGILAALDTLIERGYECVTLKELYRRRGVTAQAGALCYSCKPNGVDSGTLVVPEITVQKLEEDWVEITMQSPNGAPVYYTLDGREITYDADCYTQPVAAQLPVRLRAVAAWDLNGDRGEELFAEYTQPQAAEPMVTVENGRLYFQAADPEETVYVTIGRADAPGTGEAWETVAVEPGTWFSYYADGPEVSPSAVKQMLFTDAGNLLTDVDVDDWYYAAMDHGASMGYFRGNALNPNGTLTRGMFAELLYRYDGGEGAWNAPFRDVAADAYYARAVGWAYENGLVDGVGGGCYAPERPVTRQEMAKIFAAYLHLTPGEETAYDDQAQIAAWAQEAVAAVTADGLMQGAGGCFMPLGTATRAQIATILLRLDQLQQIQ